MLRMGVVLGYKAIFGEITEPLAPRMQRECNAMYVQTMLLMAFLCSSRDLWGPPSEVGNTQVKVQATFSIN